MSTKTTRKRHESWKRVYSCSSWTLETFQRKVPGVLETSKNWLLPGQLGNSSSFSLAFESWSLESRVTSRPLWPLNNDKEAHCDEKFVQCNRSNRQTQEVGLLAVDTVPFRDNKSLGWDTETVDYWEIRGRWGGATPAAWREMNAEPDLLPIMAYFFPKWSCLLTVNEVYRIT